MLAEQVVKDIRRQTRRQYSAEEKIRIVLKGLRGEENISELCRREGIAASMYYGWSKEFLEASKRRLAGDTARAATSGEVKDLRREALRGSDIQSQGEDYFAKLTPSAGKIKTRKARTVPLHEHLVAQGFISFVERAGAGPLFYRIGKVASDAGDRPKPKQSPAEQARSRVGQWVRSLGIDDPELSPNHAWRHTFKAQAARSGIDERYSDAITGHAPATVGRAYTTATPEDLADAIRKFPRYDVRALFS
jgi:transposase-like protein